MRGASVRLSVCASLLVALTACGGGGGSVAPNPPPAPPPPPPPPAPVATVVVTPGTANLVPNQTATLSAETRDAAGNVLAGRAVTWSTSSQAIATVSTSGLVTGVAGGSATITATSEGKSGTAAVSVADGGQVSNTGGTVNAAGGNVKIVVPAGATPNPLALTVTPGLGSAPALPDGTFGVQGTGYTFGPAGTTFSSPVTVTLKYDPAKVPTWAIASDYGIYHYTGGAWVKLANTTVDLVAHTVSGTASSFSPFQLGTRLPPAVLDPSPASVSWLVRSVTLTASVPGHPNGAFQYAWQTTGQNGALTGATAPNSPTNQYTMTQPSLPAGDLDMVQVIVKGSIAPGTAVVSLASAEVTVKANPQAMIVSVSPQFGKTGFGQAVTLDAIVNNPDGTLHTGNDIQYIWKNTNTTGTLDVENPVMNFNKRGVYTGALASQAPHINPRADKITVEFYMRNDQLIPGAHIGDPPTHNVTWPKIGSFDAFVDVAPKSYFGSFLVRTTPSPGGACIAAVALIPKVTGAASYAVQVTGIVGSQLGGSVNKQVSGPTNTGSILDVYDAGANWGVPLEGGCNTTDLGILGRQNLYANAYAHATVLSTVP